MPRKPPAKPLFPHVIRTGGNKILLAAGGPIEPFWNMYAVHRSEQVLKLLEPLKIGTLKETPQDKVRFNRRRRAKR